MSELVPPHGGRLTPRLLEGEELAEERERAKELPKVRMTSRETSDLIMIGTGAFSPLEGFMGREDWRRVCEEMRLRDGTFWPIPITLSVSREEAFRLKVGQEVALASSSRSPGGKTPLEVPDGEPKGSAPLWAQGVSNLLDPDKGLKPLSTF